MNGYGHHITGAITGITISVVAVRYYEIGSFAAAAAVFGGWVGGTLPDTLEGPAKARFIPHRTITHWLPLWLALLVVSLLPPVSQLPDMVRMAAYSTIGGALTHLLTDWPNPQGIPIKTPWKRHSLGLWRSGENELLIIIIQICAGWIVAGGLG